MDSASIPRPIRFGVFEVDLRTGELRKQGLKLKLQIQPFRILAMLLERPGELVTREEIREKLWPGDTFIDFEHSVNSSIKKLREALGDDAETPRYIETLPRRGYRFIAPLTTPESPLELSLPAQAGRGLRGGAAAPVETVAPVALPATSAAGTPPLQPVGAVREPPLRKHWRLAATGGSAAILVLLALALNVAGLRDRLLTSVGARHGVPLPKIESIAVLPLENLSGNPEQEYFADGMTDELIATLAKIGSLRVISRTSVMRYKGTKKPLPEIARELNVEGIVEGTVLRAGDRVRITAQLLHAPTDRHLWAESYESELRDVLVLQGEVARAIADEIKIKLTPQEQVRLASSRPVNPDAYRLYLQGRYFFFNRKSAAEVDKSIQFFQQALGKEPGYALAYSGLAESYGMFAYFGGALPKVAFPKAKEAALKALELDSSLAEAHAALGFVMYSWDWDWLAAESELKRAIELNPSYVTGHDWYSEYLGAMGRHEQAIAEIRRAQDLDPLSLYLLAKGGETYMVARRYDEGIEQCRKALELDPNFARATYVIGMVYILKGMPKEAAAEFEKATRLGRGHTLDMDALVYAAAGRRDEILKLVGRVRELGKRGEMTPFAMVQFYVALGDNQTALDWLEKGYDEHDPYLSGLKTNAYLDPLRSEPRFQALLRRMNFPP